MTDQSSVTNSQLTRRGVVTGAAVGAGAFGLTACGSGDEGSDKSTGAPASGASQEDGGGAVTVAASDVPVGGGFIDEANKVVVTQPKEGEYKAFSAVCTHEGCVVDKVADNTIECPCHASMFDGSTGEVTGGPAGKPLPTKTATLAGDTITVS